MGPMAAHGNQPSRFLANDQAFMGAMGPMDSVAPMAASEGTRGVHGRPPWRPARRCAQAVRTHTRTTNIARTRRSGGGRAESTRRVREAQHIRRATTSIRAPGTRSFTGAASATCCCQTLTTPSRRDNPGHFRPNLAAGSVVGDDGHEDTQAVHGRGEAARGSALFREGITAAAAELGVTRSMLWKWRGKFKGPAKPPAGAPTPLAAARSVSSPQARPRHVAKSWTPSQRAEILEHAAAHGVSVASEKFKVSRFSILNGRRALAAEGIGGGRG